MNTAPLALDVALPGAAAVIVDLPHRCSRPHPTPREYLACAARHIVGTPLPAAIRAHGAGRFAVVHVMTRPDGDEPRPILRCWCTPHEDAARREWSNLLSEDRPEHHGDAECVGVLATIWRLPRTSAARRWTA